MGRNSDEEGNFKSRLFLLGAISKGQPDCVRTVGKEEKSIGVETRVSDILIFEFLVAILLRVSRC